MNFEMIAGIVRHLFGYLGAYLVTAGLLTEGMTDEFIGGGIALAAIVWSILAKKLGWGTGTTTVAIAIGILGAASFATVGGGAPDRIAANDNFTTALTLAA